MKRILLTAFVIGASFCGSYAQDKAATTSMVVENDDKKVTMEQRKKEWQAMLVTELKLTDEQQKKIAEMDEAFAERGKAIASNTSLTEEERKEKSIALRKARHAQFTSLLSEEQQAKYKQVLESKKKG